MGGSLDQGPDLDSAKIRPSKVPSVRERLTCGAGSRTETTKAKTPNSLKFQHSDPHRSP